MSNMGTFGTFTQARLGIYAAQYGFSVTGNNISNINTVGYTRQRLEQVSLRTGGADRYASKLDVRVGNGALLTGVSQIRDPYLDIRYRTESASVGYTNTMLGGLNDLASVLDEVGDGEDENGVMTAQFNDLMEQLIKMSANAGQEEFDKLVRTSSEELCTLFNKYANSLETLQKNTDAAFKKDIDTVNDLLVNIRNLNTNIRKSEIHGDAALELRDERNNLIDELSQYVKINARYEMENLGAGQYVEKLIIELDDANPDASVHTDETILVDGVYARQFKLPETTKAINPAYGFVAKDPDNITPEEQAKLDAAGYKYIVGGFNPDYDPDDLTSLPYLDADGNPTADVTKAFTNEKRDDDGKLIEPEASQVENTNYNLTLSGLQDSKNRFMQLKALDKDGNVIIENGAIKYIDDPPVVLDDNDLYGALQAKRELLTEAGEFSTTGVINGVDESASTKRGIPYYQYSLDLLARQFANQFNELNNGYAINEDGSYVKQKLDANGDPELNEKGNIIYEPIVKPVTYYTDAAGNISLTSSPGAVEHTAYLSADMTEDDLKAINLKRTADGEDSITDVDEFLANKDNGAVKMGGPLFSNNGDSDDTNEITAKNISVSVGWSSGAWHIVTTYQKLFDEEGNNTTQNDNQDRMITMIDKNNKTTVYNPQDLVEDAKSDHLFQGSYQEMLNNMCTELGKDQRKTEIMLNTYYTTAMDLDVSRDGVSGVDLNDEAMNLMTYQKAYAAACRLMTTIDEALDRLINNTAM